MKADLHIHSNVSDGSDSVGRIIEKAKAKGLDLIIITDHDTMAHRFKLAGGGGLRAEAGVEISAIHKPSKMKAHILGYNIAKPELIETLTLPLLEARSANSEKQARILADAGYHIDMEKLNRADGKYLYKQHIMEWLVKTEQTSDMFGEFYKTTFKGGGVCDFDIEYIDVFEAVKTIKDAGGFAVLAHPGQQHNFSLIPALVKAGLDGLELNHHSNSIKDKQTILEYSKAHGLFLTGGSDYHGDNDERAIEIGDYLSHESGLAALF